MSNAEIANALFVSDATAKTHVSHVLAKLDVTAYTLVRFGPCPSVQLALVTEYPTLRPIQGRLVQNAAIQRLSPQLPLLITLPPFPMHAALLRSEYYGGSATTRCPQRASRLPTTPPDAGWGRPFPIL
jgi:hypothetical protein